MWQWVACYTYLIMKLCLWVHLTIQVWVNTYGGMSIAVILENFLALYYVIHLRIRLWYWITLDGVWVESEHYSYLECNSDGRVIIVSQLCSYALLSLWEISCSEMWFSVTLILKLIWYRYILSSMLLRLVSRAMCNYTGLRYEDVN